MKRSKVALYKAGWRIMPVLFALCMVMTGQTEAADIKWDAGKSTPVCTEAHDQEKPAVSYDEELDLIIVWEDKRPAGKKEGTKHISSVYGKYMKQDKEFVVYSPADSNALTPDISGRNVVFNHNRGWENVRLKELPDGKSKHIGSVSYTPAIEGTMAVFSSAQHRWKEWTGKGAPKAKWVRDVLVYELDGSGLAMDVTHSDKALSNNPDVSGRTVVWQESRRGGWNSYSIYKQDLNTDPKPVQICKHPGKSSQNPAISGSIIVWQDNRNGNWDIYGYDLDTKKEMVIYKGAGDQTAPDIDGRIIVWQDMRSGSWDIYGYNLDTKKVFVVYKGKEDQTEPAIYKDTIVWTDDRDGNKDIYMNQGENKEEIL